MRIGFDVAQTCVEKAGCGWYADALIHAMVRLAPQHDYAIYHHFAGWINATTSAGTTFAGADAAEPFRELSASQAESAWDRIRAGEPLPGQPDIVHANCYQAPRLTGTKLVYTVYDISFWMVPEYTTEANRLTCQDGVLKALGNADGFIFISQSSRAEFERVLPGWLARSGKPWVVTPLGAKSGTMAVPRPAIRSYWAAVGSLEPRKNYDALLSAMEIYWRRSSRRLPLRIAGGQGWKSEELRGRIQEMHRRGIVTHLGYVPDEQLPGLYAGAEALIFPSWYEGFGLPVVEAMTYGCPAISSDRASLKEVGGDAALYVDPSEPDELAKVMLRLEVDAALQNDLSRMSLVQGSKFNWDATAVQTLEFYHRVLAEPPV